MGLRFQVLFHSPRRGSFRLSLTVLLRYRSYPVFSLGSWSTRIPTGFLVPRRTQDSAALPSSFQIRGFHPLWQAFPKPFSYHDSKVIAVLQPRSFERFRLLRFRSPLLSESLLISFPGVLRWFSSPSPASAPYIFRCGYRDRSRWVTPFGYRRILGCVLLPAAFRSLPRPSSPGCAKASTCGPSFRLTILLFRRIPLSRFRLPPFPLGGFSSRFSVKYLFPGPG